jgi:hypothetical protein
VFPKIERDSPTHESEEGREEKEENTAKPNK